MNNILTPVRCNAPTQNDRFLISTAGWRRLTRLLCGMLVLFVTVTAQGFDSTPFGKPTQEDLADGGYKLIYKNKAGEVVKEDRYNHKKTMTQEKKIAGYHKNGQPTGVETFDFKVDGQGKPVLDASGQPIKTKSEWVTFDNNGVRTHYSNTEYLYDETGKLTRETTTTKDPITDEPLEREIHDYNPEGIREQVWDKEQKKWKTPKPGKGKEKKKPAPERPKREVQEIPGAPNVLFRAGEVQIRFFGIGGTGHDEHIVTDEVTVKETKTVTETTIVKETVLKDIPGKPGLTPVDEDVPVTTKHKETVKRTEKRRRNDAALQGGFGGLGADAKVFVTRNIGLGVEGDWLDGDSSAGVFLATLTARFPIGSNAPYVVAGAGVQCGDRAQAVGELGGGVEHRFSPTCGIFGDASWLFGEHENAVVFRLGVTCTFGPSGEPIGRTTAGSAEHVSWSEINPIAKGLHQ